MEELIRQGADVNSKCRHGGMPLHAVVSLYPDCALLLIKVIKIDKISKVYFDRSLHYNGVQQLEVRQKFAFKIPDPEMIFLIKIKMVSERKLIFRILSLIRINFAR